ncbi:MAG TPA: hypothetical protein VHS05_26270 [Pyrinomonadaceae bacterium]|nr:hypothetical protein [Pyrinomonadaceae bacterium]
MAPSHCRTAAGRRRRGRRERIGQIIALILVATWSFSQPPVALALQKRPPSEAEQRELDAKGLEEFQEEVAEYIELRRRLDKKLAPLPPKPSPESVHAYQSGLEKLLAAKRARSEEGDLFVSEVRPLLRRVCREVLAGPGGRELRAEIYDEAPKRTFRIRINTRYPSELPLSTVPYRLLSVLPPLPAELEYRIVGRDLVLLDIDAQMVVDVLRNVVPR